MPVRRRVCRTEPLDAHFVRVSVLFVALIFIIGVYNM
jgi:hypothetical protein